MWSLLSIPATRSSPWNLFLASTLSYDLSNNYGPPDIEVQSVCLELHLWTQVFSHGVSRIRLLSISFVYNIMILLSHERRKEMNNDQCDNAFCSSAKRWCIRCRNLPITTSFILQVQVQHYFHCVSRSPEEINQLHLANLER